VATSAWIVPVWTTRLGYGPAMLVAYIAAFESAEEARAAVVSAIGALEGDDVREAVAVSESTVTALRLAPGQVHML
jgi:hypothetical protein